MRTWLKEMPATLDASHGERVVIYGTTELAELAYLSLRERTSIAGGIDGNPRESFLARPVSAPAKVSGWQFDRVLIADEFAESGVSREKVLKLGLAE